jgi:hypothetical protein
MGKKMFESWFPDLQFDMVTSLGKLIMATALSGMEG